MGAFHDGHLSLMRRARAECDVVVVSLFVNPTQFNDASDLAAYPRDEARDAALAEEIGVDFLFAPAVEEVYPPASPRPCPSPGSPRRSRARSAAAAHFDGVTTVVTKLFNMVAPDVAYFGQKDAQQAVVDPAARARPRHAGPDRGLRDGARAGRARDVQPQRPPLRRGARAGDRAAPGARRDRRRARRGCRRRGALRARAAAELRAAAIEPEYLAIVSAETLAPVQRVEGEVLALVAARVGTTSLIDNHRLMPARVTAGATNNGRQ